jgi:hypothetical protein
MRTPWCIAGLLLVATMAVTGIARADERADNAAGLFVPPNITMPIDMRAAIERLLPQSSTLRRQCAAIGAAPPWVRITMAPARPVFGGIRASGSFTWTKTGKFEGRIEIPLSSDFPELVAHELEHVVEQLEGLDLRRLAKASGSGVKEVDQGMFETVRARDAGRAAACEVDTEKRLERARRATLAAAPIQRAATGTFELSHDARR